MTLAENGVAIDAPRRAERPVAVQVLTRYPRQGPSSRLRFFQWIDAFAGDSDLAFEATPFFEDDYLRARFRRNRTSLLRLGQFYRRRMAELNACTADVRWIEVEALPGIPAPLERLLIGGTPYVIDFDDAWFLRYAGPRFSPLTLLLGQKYKRLVQGAAAVIVGNDFLAGWATSCGAENVHVVPTTVDPARYRPRDWEMTASDGNGELRLGWIGTPLTTPYLTRIAPALRELAIRMPIRLCVIGNTDFSLDGVPLELHPWSAETEGALLATCDIGLMPLAGSLWDWGKCGYKLIQYMAVGLPLIASPVGANLNIVVDGHNGFFARRHEDWVETISALAADRPAMRRLGANGRAMAETRYSTKAHARRLAGILAEAAGAGARGRSRHLSNTE